MKDRRNDFSIFKKNGNITYLDYAATTFMPDQVIMNWVDYQQNIGVSCNRGNGILSDYAQQEYINSKSNILKFFDAENEYDLLLGKNATECLNIMAYSLKEKVFQGDIILMGPYEHHSNILPWEKVAREMGACLVQLPLLENGEINYDFYDILDKKRVKIISISMISNINAYTVDTTWIKKVKKDCNALFILDASQMVGHCLLECKRIDADAYIMSAHKMYGPKNIAAAIVKKQLIDEMNPVLVGGGMVWNSLGETPSWQLGYRKFEVGTFDVGLVRAWSESCEYLKNIGMDVVSESDEKIWAYVRNRLDKKLFSVVPGASDFSSMVSFVVNSVHPHDIAEVATSHNFEIRTGHMCAQGTLEQLGYKSLCRLSWGIGSDISDIEAFVCLIEEECING